MYEKSNRKALDILLECEKSTKEIKEFLPKRYRKDINENQKIIDNAEYLDIVMPMYNLLEYSKNYSKTTGSFWNYYRDEPNSGLGGNNNNVNYSIKDSKSFDYKTSITGKLEGNNTDKEIEIVVPLKHLSNFWRTLDFPLTVK